MNKKNLLFLLSSFTAIIMLTMVFKAGEFGIPNSLILEIRMEKSITLFMGSFSIGFSTYILQRFTRNKIVDSSFFGISSFNVLVLAVLYFYFADSINMDRVYKIYMPFLSIAASVFISLVLMLTLLNGSQAKSKDMVLTGIVLNYLFMGVAYAIIKWLEPEQAGAILDITIGAINEGYSNLILFVLLTVQIGSVIWYQLIYKKIYVTDLHEQISSNLGNRTKIVKVQQIIIVGLNVAVGFSLLGAVSFIGIIAANLTMKVTKDSRWSGMVSGLCAAFVTALAYLLINGFMDLYYPIGITSSLITIPYFIYKVSRSKDD